MCIRDRATGAAAAPYRHGRRSWGRTWDRAAAVSYTHLKTLAVEQGVALPILAWALALGTDIGGSATPIGASANVVGTSAAAKAGHPISWGRYCKKIAPATALVLIICTIGLFVRYL